MLIAVFLHLGNHDLWPEFKLLLRNVYDNFKEGTVDLYVAYQKEHPNLDEIRKLYPGAELMESLRGMDIGGQLLMTQKAIDSNKNYDYVLKLHTKSNLNWRYRLIKPLCSSIPDIQKVIKLFEDDETIGMIGAEGYHIAYRDNLYTRPMVEQFLKNWEIPITDDMTFIGGTIFWFRWSVMKQFFIEKKIDVIKECDNMELGYTWNWDPSPPHSWERIFGMLQSHYGCRVIAI